MAKSAVERKKKYIQKIEERKHEIYLEKQRKQIRNYRPKEKSKISLVFLIVNVLWLLLLFHVIKLYWYFIWKFEVLLC